MSLTRLKLISYSLGIVLLLLISLPALADEFQYFNKGLDYWNETVQKVDSAPNVKIEPIKEAPKAEGAFPWSNFLDPKNKEFFREGDYLPPEPFMELVRNPSDENIKMWFAYMDRKNELAQRLEIKVAEYAERHGLQEPQKAQMKMQVEKKAPVLVNSKRYRFRMYFSSTCPHCQRMMGTMNELQNKGFFVEARQIDAEKGVLRTPFPTEPATKAELSQKGIQSVPLLLVGDLKNRVVYRLSGYQSTDNVLNALAQNETHPEIIK